MAQINLELVETRWRESAIGKLARLYWMEQTCAFLLGAAATPSNMATLNGFLPDNRKLSVPLLHLLQEFWRQNREIGLQQWALLQTLGAHKSGGSHMEITAHYLYDLVRTVKPVGNPETILDGNRKISGFGYKPHHEDLMLGNIDDFGKEGELPECLQGLIFAEHRDGHLYYMKVQIGVYCLPGTIVFGPEALGISLDLTRDMLTEPMSHYLKHVLLDKVSFVEYAGKLRDGGCSGYSARIFIWQEKRWGENAKSNNRINPPNTINAGAYRGAMSHQYVRTPGFTLHKEVSAKMSQLLGVEVVVSPEKFER